jgi:predicted Rossmann fold nucleotide-binding protein DprA/Smf involved in DNA uptake
MLTIGEPKLENAIAIVGTRKPSDAVDSLVKELVKALGGEGYSIITGGAIGVDSIAIKYAIAYNVPYTIVKPCLTGIEKPPPGGALISPYQCKRFSRRYFVERDRVIAELARVIVVPEARSGTARYACCGTWYTAVKFGVRSGKPAFIFKPLVNEPDVWEAFMVMVGGGVKPIASVSELFIELKRLRGGGYEAIQNGNRHYPEECSD